MTISRFALTFAAALAAAAVSAQESDPEPIPYLLDREPAVVVVPSFLGTCWGPLGVTNVTDAPIGPEYPCYNLYTTNQLSPGHLAVEMAQIAKYFRWPLKDSLLETQTASSKITRSFLVDEDGDGVYDYISSNKQDFVTLATSGYVVPPPTPEPEEEEEEPEEEEEEEEPAPIVQGMRNYDWDLMINRPQSQGVAEKNRQAIGRLCYDCMASLAATMSATYYYNAFTGEETTLGGFTGSGACNTAASAGFINGLISYFAYHCGTAYLVDKADKDSPAMTMYDFDVQHRALHSNLIARRPVQLRFRAMDPEPIDPTIWRPDAATTTYPRHYAIVPPSTNTYFSVLCDGYGYEGTNEYVHLIFSDHGVNDGWYNLAAMTNETITVTDNYLRYRLGKLVGSLFNIQPHPVPGLPSGIPNMLAGEVVSLRDDGNFDLRDEATVNLLVHDAGNLYLEYEDIYTTEPGGGYVFMLPTNGIPDMKIRAVWRNPKTKELMVSERQGELGTLKLNRSKEGTISTTSAANMGNAWYRLELEPARAIVDEREPFLSLEYAMIKAARNSRRPSQLKICRDIEFSSQEWTLVSNIVISCTNETPALAAVRRTGEGRLICPEEIEVAFSNVVFQAFGPDRPSVEVRAGAKVSLYGTVDFGCVLLNEGACLNIATKPDDLERSFEIDQQGNNVEGALFATSSIPLAVAQTFANRYVNARDDRLVGIASVNADTGVTEFRWGFGEIPDCAAVVRLYQGAAGEYVNYRDLTRALAAQSEDAVLEVVRDCDFTNQVTLAHNLRIVGTAGAPRRFNIPGIKSSDRFTIPSGVVLELGNIILSGHAGGELFSVTGGELVLGDGAVVFDCSYRTSATAKFALATVSNGGRIRLGAGSLVSGCENLQGSGGFAYLGANCEIEFAGGVVTNCISKGRGGAVYVADGARAVATGPSMVIGNAYRSSSTTVTADDVYFVKTNELFEVAGDLSGGCIGLFYQLPPKKVYTEIPYDRCGTNNVFATVTAALSPLELIELRAVFENLRYPGTLRAEATETGDELYWAAIPYSPAHSPLPPEEWEASWCRAEVVYEGSVTERWEHADWAINQLGDRPAMVTLLKDDVLTESISLESNKVVLASLAGSDLKWTRSADCRIDVGDGAQLSLTNLTVNGGGYEALFYVNGGVLKLTDCDIYGVVGRADRAQGAITIYNEGTCYLDGATTIRNCYNLYVNASQGTSVGGGILVDSGELYLHGDSQVYYNHAYKAAGIFLGNSGDLYFGDNVKVFDNVNNCDSDEGNLTYHYMCAMQLDRPLGASADINCNPGIGGSTNIFCAVAEDYSGDWESITNSAPRFTRDRSEGLVHAIVVTNAAGQAFFAWADCLTVENPICIGRDKESYYYAAGEIYVTDPPAPPVPPAEPEPIAFSSVVIDGDQVTLRFTNGITRCRYFLYATNSLEGGFVVPTDGSGALRELTATEDGEQVFTVPVTEEVLQYFKALALPEVQD